VGAGPAKHYQPSEHLHPELEQPNQRNQHILSNGVYADDDVQDLFLIFNNFLTINKKLQS
jgi:hypothetical protein